MRYFILVFSILTIACGSESIHDLQADSLMMDSIKNVMQYEKFDSIPFRKMELWRKEGEGNFHAIELRYTNSQGKPQRVALLDSFPYYLYYHRNVDFEPAQLTGYGSSEIIIRFGGSWGGAQPEVAREEDLECFFVVDMENSKLLWRGVTQYHFEQRVADGVPDSLFGPFKVGYDYKLHVANGQLLIDSLNYFGDSADGPPDHPPGHYQWKNGSFVRM